MLLATVLTIVRAIAAGDFYNRTDFAPATWAAGLALRRGDLDKLYHAAWLYPPPMGLVAVPLSLFPLPLGFWVWMAGTNVFAAWLLRLAGLRWLVIVAGLLGPACFYNFLLGQNGALTAGLLLGSLLMQRRRPVLAGALAGCLCIKPQMGALLPVVFCGNRRWQPLLASSAAAAGLILAATALFGVHAWALFATVAQPEAHRQLVARFGGEYQLAAYSVFMMARSLGFGLAAAWAAQAVGAIVAIRGTLVIWRRDGTAPVPRAMLTICFAMLAVPFGFSYDLIAFSVAVVAMLPLTPFWQWPILAVLWLWPGLTTLLTMHAHVIFMPLAAVSGILLTWPMLERSAPNFDRAAPIH